MRPWRSGGGLLASGLTAVLVAVVATVVVRQAWPAYAVAEPTRAYSLAMLLARLGVGALCTVGAAVVTTRVARDRGQTAWWLGALALALSLPDHLVRVWAAYPVSYHALYLSSLVPIAGCSGRVAARQRRAHGERPTGS